LRFPGFVGPSYTNASINVAAQRAVNLFPEFVEVEEQQRIVFSPTPGLRLFATLTEGPVRALFRTDTRVFAVGGTKFEEIGPDGTVTTRGSVEGASSPATIHSNGVELFITSGGLGYIYTLATDTLALIQDPDFPGASFGAYLDGYFVGLEPNRQRFWISGLYSGAAWDPLDFASAEAAPDNAVAMIVDHRELWIFGSESAEGFYNSGNADFPLSRIDGSFIEQGCAAAHSVAKLDNAIFWLAGGSQGLGVVTRLQQGFERISTHAVETAIQGYGRVDDAIGYAYQDRGHTFYVLTFPTASATWVYDVSTKLWHERAYYDIAAAPAAFKAHRAACHVHALGKHLVGDRENGKVYELRHDVYTDNGAIIRRVRRAPHISRENRRLFYSSFELHLEAGNALPVGQGSDPKVLLRWSNDGGHTWSYERELSAGLVGQYTRRAIAYRLGSGRDRVFEVAMTDPIRWTLLDAYIEVSAN
jgi:hypothetical protein